MLDGMNEWGAAEWWLAASIWCLFVLYAGYGLVQFVLERIPPHEADRQMRARADQGRQHDIEHREWFAEQRRAAREWLRDNDWRAPEHRLESNNALD